MAEAKAAKAPPSDKQLLTRAIGQALWKSNADAEETKMTGEEKRANWQQNREAYLQVAKGVVRRLEHDGYQFTKLDKAAAAKARDERKASKAAGKGAKSAKA